MLRLRLIIILRAVHKFVVHTVIKLCIIVNFILTVLVTASSCEFNHLFFLSSIGAIARTDLKNFCSSDILLLKGAKMIDLVEAFCRV